jgi:hypothetical protein
MGFDATIEFVEDEAALDELYDLREMIKNRITQIVIQMSWKLGQAVQMRQEYRHKKPFDAVGIVVKINQVKLIIDFGEYGVLTRPKTMIESVSQNVSLC